MVRIGLISDTHGLMRVEALAALAGVEAILHAGDVGERTVLTELGALAPVHAVCGNVDDASLGLSATLKLSFGGVTIHMTHGHELGSPTPHALARRYAGDVIVFGHTHRPLIQEVDGRLVVNPGAAGPRRFNLQPTVAVLTIEGGTARAQIVSLLSG